MRHMRLLSTAYVLYGYTAQHLDVSLPQSKSKLNRTTEVDASVSENIATIHSNRIWGDSHLRITAGACFLCREEIIVSL